MSVLLICLTVTGAGKRVARFKTERLQRRMELQKLELHEREHFELDTQKQFDLRKLEIESQRTVELQKLELESRTKIALRKLELEAEVKEKNALETEKD